MKILSALMGMTIGVIVSAVLSCFVLLPWEYKLDPQGHNHAIGFVLPFVLLVGVVCGLFLGLRLDTLRRRRLENYGKNNGSIPPKAQDAKPDDTVWPPPPASPTERQNQ